MQRAVLLLFLLISSCAYHHKQTSQEGPAFAQDTLANGKVHVTAFKTIEHQDVCFEITLKIKEATMKEALTSNWTAAWLDKESKYHLLNLNQRDPASVPQGRGSKNSDATFNEWSNTFRTCAPEAKISDVKILILTPKELSYHTKSGLQLEWK